MSKQRLEFVVTIGSHNHITLRLTVEEGKIIKIHESIYHYLHGNYSYHEYTPESRKGEFESAVSSTINEFFNNRKDIYCALVNSLSSEMLEKYFKPFYIPK